MKRNTMRLLWPPFLVVFLLLAGWELAVAVWNVPQWLLPGPLQIMAESATIFPRLAVHTAATIRIAVYGFAIGSGIGLAAAVLLHAVLPRLKPGLYPLIILSQNIPIIALAPLLVIWFGYGMLPKLIIIALVCFFPVTVAAMDGFAQTDRNMLNYMQMIGASRRDVFLKLEFPFALPYLFSGLKISATYSVMGAVIAEWIGAQQGLGVFMMLSKSAFRTDRVFAAIFVIAGLSLALFGLILLAERLIIRWNPKPRGED